MTAAAADLGANGPAQALRPRAAIQVATGETGIGRESAEAQRYLDGHIIDRMHARGQLWDRIYAAACRLVELHEAAGLEPQQCARYAPTGWLRGHDDDTPEAGSTTEFRAVLGALHASQSALLHSLCLGTHPGVGRLAECQALLGALATMWGIE